MAAPTSAPTAASAAAAEAVAAHFEEEGKVKMQNANCKMQIADGKWRNISKTQILGAGPRMP
jgi:hypothetical protein